MSSAIWSQADFAQATELQESRVSRIINGRIPPSPIERKKFEQALGQDLVQRAFDEEDKHESDGVATTET